MKKIFSFCFVIILLITMASCGPKPEEQVKDFAVKFGDFVNTNQKDSIQKYYPDFELTDSLATVPVGNITVNPGNTEGVYLAEFSSETFITVKLKKDGKISILESKGVFSFPEQHVELAQKENKWENNLSDIQKRNIITEALGNRNSFTSPDLDFFNLHGPVKEMTVSISSSKDEYGYETQPYGGFWLGDGKYLFNEEGEWINYKASNILNIKRNSDGYIVDIFLPPLYDDGSKYDKSNYVWKSNLLSKVTDPWDWGNFSFIDGVLSSFNYTICPGEGHGYWDINFTDYQFDNLGNWISCTWTGKYHDDYGDTGKAKGKVKRVLKYF